MSEAGEKSPFVSRFTQQRSEADFEAGVALVKARHALEAARVIAPVESEQERKLAEAYKLLEQAAALVSEVEEIEHQHLRREGDLGKKGDRR